jgi:Na+-driven multidrug efflux pump
VVGVLARGRAGLRLRPSLLRPHGGLLKRLLRVSVPAAADSLSIGVAQLWFLGIVNSLGPVAAGAHGVALGWEALGYLSGGAFATAATALVGQYLGAGRPADAARSGWTAFAMGGAVMSVMGVTFFALAEPMFRVFCPDPGQRPIIAAGVPVLRLVAFAMPALASCIIFTGALRGAGDTRVPVLFTWLGFFAVRIPLAYLLTGEGVGLGLFGAWLAMFADLVVRGVFFLARFAGGRWQRIKV